MGDHDEPGVEQSEINRQDDYWEARGLDRLCKIILKAFVPTLIALLCVLWWVSRSSGN